jgi:catechol 2,3-dioxygenase
MVPDQASLNGIYDRLERAGASSSRIERGLETQDPFGNRVKIVVNG